MVSAAQVQPLQIVVQSVVVGRSQYAILVAVGQQRAPVPLQRMPVTILKDAIGVMQHAAPNDRTRWGQVHAIRYLASFDEV